MTYPVFASGDVLQAADMNAVGLWLVKSQTIGSAVSTVTVSDAFSTNYDNYKIIVSGGVGSTDGFLRLTFGATTSGYGNASMGNELDSGTYLGGNNDYNTVSYIDAGAFTSNVISADIEVQNPYTAKNTIIYARHLQAVAGGRFTHITGVLANTTSYTAFTFTTSTGTITGGTVKVYGYLN
jgi:hypothetical protein